MKVKFTISQDKEGMKIDGKLISHIRNRNGIVEIANGSTGSGHSCHPNIDISGSVSGMKKNGGWRKDDVIVRAHGAQFNKSSIFCSDTLDRIAHEIEYNNRWDLVSPVEEWKTEEREFEYNPK